MSFEEAQYAFVDGERIIAQDEKHRAEKERWFCFGRVKGRVLIVRFTFRNKTIRIIRAGFWRKGAKFYEE